MKTSVTSFASWPQELSPSIRKGSSTNAKLSKMSDSENQDTHPPKKDVLIYSNYWNICIFFLENPDSQVWQVAWVEIDIESCSK